MEVTWNDTRGYFLASAFFFQFSHSCDLSLTLFIPLALIPLGIIPNTRNSLMGRLVNLRVRVNTTVFSCQWRNEKRKLWGLSRPHDLFISCFASISRSSWLLLVFHKLLWICSECWVYCQWFYIHLCNAVMINIVCAKQSPVIFLRTL